MNSKRTDTSDKRTATLPRVIPSPRDSAIFPGWGVRV
jgi:hypothetical protein